jgi:hypothetical protein
MGRYTHTPGREPMLSTDVCGANLNAALEKREFVIEGTIVHAAGYTVSARRAN